MFKLTQETAPYMLTLRQGVKLEVRPIDTMIYETARGKATRQIIKIKDEIADIKKNGGDVVGLPDLTDEDAAAGYAKMIFVQALARSAIISWEGVEDKDGKPAPLNDENIDLLMKQHQMAEDFIIAYTAPKFEIDYEGNA